MLTPPQPKRAPGAGRPPKPPGEALAVRVPVYLTPAEAEELDRVRGTITRSDYLARHAGIRPG